MIPLILVQPQAHHGASASWLSLISGGALLALLVVLYASSLGPLQRLFRKEPDMAKDFQLTVPDMTCNHCKMTVTRILTGVEGVKEVEVDLTAHKVSIDLAPEVSRELLMEKLREGGYSPERS